MTQLTHSRLSGGPPCGYCDFLIAVLGNNHGQSQRPVVFQTAAPPFPGAERRLPDGIQKSYLKIPGDGESALHIWPWRNQPASRAVLEVDAESGPPIHLPLTEAPAPESIHSETPANILMPTVPMAWVRGMEHEGKHLSWPALARPGFLYLFQNGVLWRELRIVWEGNQPQFQDVRLADHRTEDGQISDDRRPAVGKPLSDIWVPIRLNAQDQSLEAAYSESPLSAARLNCLQNDFGLRQYRCSQFRDLYPADQPQMGFARWPDAAKRTVFRLDKVEAQRPRAPAKEWQFERPWEYLADTTGTYTGKALDMAISLHDEWNTGERTEPLSLYEHPEPAALGIAIQQSLDRTNETKAQRPFSYAEWRTGTCQPDALEDLRARGVCGLRIEDHFYEMRHQQARINTARHLLNLCAEKARKNPQLENALLVNQIILPGRIGRQKNPLFKYSLALPSSGRQKIRRVLMTEERTLGQHYLTLAQAELLQCLKRQPYQQALADLFSTEGFDYAGAFRCAGHFISDTLEPACKQDPLDPEHSQPSPDSDGKAWVRSLCTEQAAASASREEVSLARMLWPQTTSDSQSEHYQHPETPEPNDGTGVFRGAALAALEKLDLPEDISDILTVEGLLLAEDIQSGASNTLMLAGMRSGMKTLDSAHRELHQSIRSAMAALENNDRQLQNLTDEQTRLAQRRAALKAEHDAASQEWMKRNSDEAFRKEQAAAKALKDFDEASARLEQQQAETRQAIQHRLMAQRIAAMANPMEGIRRAMPEMLPDLRQMTLSDAIAQGKYILGLEDLGPDGARYNPETPAAGKALVWVLSRDKPTTQAIQALTRAENNLTLARRALAEANGNHEELRAKLQAAQNRYNQVVDELKQTGGRIRDINADIRKLEGEAKAHRVDLNAAERSRLHRVLNTPALPLVVLAIEAVNVANAVSSRQKVSRERGAFRSLAGMGMSGYGAGLASVLLAERFANESLRTKIATVLQYKFQGEGAKIIAKVFRAEALTVKMFLGGIGGLALTGVSLSDTIYAINTGDQAALGHGIVTVGGVVTTLSALVPAQLTLLGMGPLGWAGLSLILGGALLVALYEDEPIENWLKNGPFGEHDGLPHIQGDDNALEAWYRLVYLLSQVRVSMYPIPEITRVALKRQGLDNHDLAQATHLIRLESNLPGMTGFTEQQMTFKLQLLSHRVKQDSNHSIPLAPQPVPDTEMQSYILREGATPDGYEFIVRTPSPDTETTSFLGIPLSTRNVSYTWQPKAQIRVETGIRELAFPAPPPKDSTIFDVKDNEHTEPDFSNKKQLFWINEFSSPGATG
ncbi:ABC transporter permease [Marinobacter daepoensis]|uniref:ABC transporter permease n=1 Tax=Marinobacter daepoensis TaxID=262077 RepID=A0ABS3BKZ9_9GAMM|nr:ABC transporter permease [Marinobacter daepoensis]MBN7770900.1 ABC transporter permease [Marinobacter daepoensis]MBY6078762.1 ABC transporter permease [Marinobacter daepoensis]